MINILRGLGIYSNNLERFVCIGVLVDGEGPGEAGDSVGEGFGGGGYCVLANSRYFGTG